MQSNGDCWLMIGDAEFNTGPDLALACLDRIKGLIVVGEIAKSFMACFGYEVDSSELDRESVRRAMLITIEMRRRKLPLELPLDYVLIDNPNDIGSIASVSYDELPMNSIIADIGPQTLLRFEDVLSNAQSIAIIGSITRFENPLLRVGTRYFERFLMSRFKGNIVLIGDEAQKAFDQLSKSHRAKQSDTKGFLSMIGVKS